MEEDFFAAVILLASSLLLPLRLAPRLVESTPIHTTVVTCSRLKKHIVREINYLQHKIDYHSHRKRNDQVGKSIAFVRVFCQCELTKRCNRTDPPLNLSSPADGEARRAARGRSEAVEPPCRDQAARHHAQRAEGQARHNEGRVPAHRLGRWKPSRAPGEIIGTGVRGHRLSRESEKKHTSLYRIGSTTRSTVPLTPAWSSAPKYHTKLANIIFDDFFDLTALYLIYSQLCTWYIFFSYYIIHIYTSCVLILAF